ncbi:hypothetical protein J6590_027078 [Homalodisca vitripennis]|nr:hypothetical protein J6590_027078 [Homalodisca vitripennis]
MLELMEVFVAPVNEVVEPEVEIVLLKVMEFLALEALRAFIGRPGLFLRIPLPVLVPLLLLSYMTLWEFLHMLVLMDRNMEQNKSMSHFV